MQIKKETVHKYLKNITTVELNDLKEHIEKELDWREAQEKLIKEEKESKPWDPELDIFNVKLPSKLYNILRNEKIKNLRELEQWSREDFLELKNSTRYDLQTLIKIMNHYNLSLKE